MAEFVSGLMFTLFVLLTVVPALLVVLTVNIVRAACWLLLSLAGAAALFFFLGADFVGATQILIYVGGTLVLLIFGVMLTATGPFVNLRGRSGDWGLAVFAGAALLTVLVFGITRIDFADTARFPGPAATTNAAATTNRIGLAFLSLSQAEGASFGADQPGGYLLPFEIVSVHLVVVLIGAAYLARAKRRRPREAQA